MSLLTLFMGPVPSDLQKSELKLARDDKIFRFEEIFASICERHRALRRSYLRPSFKKTNGHPVKFKEFPASWNPKDSRD